MAKYKKTTSPETVTEATKIAKATQRPGQSKEQTRLIAQGIQKGIEQYKKQHKIKSRELDKKLKSYNRKIQEGGPEQAASTDESDEARKITGRVAIPWVLLVISWVFFVLYVYWL